MSTTETSSKKEAVEGKKKSSSHEIQNMLPVIPPGAGGTIREFTANDVLSGRGGKINQHGGNIHFRKLISENKLEYLAESTKKLDKAKIAAKIISSIRNLDPPGRFLKEKNKKEGTWTEIGDEKARKKAGQALREDGPDIRIKEIEKKEKEENTRKMMMSHAPYYPYPGHAGHQIPPHMMVTPGAYYPPPGVPYPHQVPPPGFYTGYQHLQAGYPYMTPFPASQMHQDPSIPQAAPIPNMQQPPNYYPMPSATVSAQAHPQAQEMSNPQVVLQYQTPQNPVVPPTYTNIQNDSLNERNGSTEQKKSQSQKSVLSHDSSGNSSSTFDSQTLKALSRNDNQPFHPTQIAAMAKKSQSQKSMLSHDSSGNDSSTFDSQTLKALSRNDNQPFHPTQIAAMAPSVAKKDSNKIANENNTTEIAVHGQAGWAQNQIAQTSFAALRAEAEQEQIMEPTPWKITERFHDRNEHDDEDGEDNVPKEQGQQTILDTNSVDMSWKSGMASNISEEIDYYQQISSSQQTLQTSGADANMWASGNVKEQEHEGHPPPKSTALSTATPTGDMRAEWRLQMQEAKDLHEQRNQMIEKAMGFVTGRDQKLTGISEDDAKPHDKMDEMRSIDSKSYSEFMSIGTNTMDNIRNIEESIESQSSKRNYRRSAMYSMSEKHQPTGGYPNSINKKSNRSLVSAISNDYMYEGSESGSTFFGSSRSILSDLTSLSIDFQGDMNSHASKPRLSRVQEQQTPSNAYDYQQR